MTYYSVLDVTPTNDAWIPAYVPTATQLVAKHGGRYLSRTATHETVEGSSDPVALRVIVEWPSKDAAMAFMNDPDYAPHLKARTEGSQSNHFLMAGKDDMV
jgi:uncharacterized protein (DUF1330 family)